MKRSKPSEDGAEKEGSGEEMETIETAEETETREQATAAEVPPLF